MIPYVRTVNYLSPSSLRKLEDNAIEFYLRRLGPTETMPPEEPRGTAALVGLAFDGMVKRRICELKGLPCASLAFMTREVTGDGAEAALALGRDLVERYESSGALAALLDEGVESLGATLEDFAPGTTVPIQCKLDASLRGLVPHDWKVRGGGSPGSYAPTPGYNRLICSGVEGRKAKVGPHKRAGEAFESLSPEWATQLAMYGWALGRLVAPMPVSIDELVVEDAGLRVAQFRGTISEQFQRELLARLVDAWTRIREWRVVDEDVAKHEHGAEAMKWVSQNLPPSIFAPRVTS